MCDKRKCDKIQQAGIFFLVSDISAEVMTDVLTRVLVLQGSGDDWEMLRKATKQNLIRLEMLGNRIKANRGQH